MVDLRKSTSVAGVKLAGNEWYKMELIASRPEPDLVGFIGCGKHFELLKQIRSHYKDMKGKKLQTFLKFCLP
jgi:hypothetical protein